MLRYNGVLNISMTLIIILFIGFGFFGYLKYGEDIKGSISLNLPPSDILAQVSGFTLPGIWAINSPISGYLVQISDQQKEFWPKPKEHFARSLSATKPTGAIPKPAYYEQITKQPNISCCFHPR